MKRSKSTVAHTKALQDMRKARKKVVRMLNRHTGETFDPETFTVIARKFYFFSL